MDHPRPGLRYVDADDLDDSTIDFDGMDVESNTGEKLGDVDGFIIDLRSVRPYYVVVDAGSWFTSKYVLVPVGHLGLDTERAKLVADIPLDRVKRYPGFDRDEFARLSEDELNRMDEQMTAACCPDDIRAGSSTQLYDTRRHYLRPTWWDSNLYRADRANTSVRSMASTGTAATAAGDAEKIHATPREHVVARSNDDSTAGDVSPHFGGRAQPGDVLGVETGGEQTHVGDTTDDENKRRRDAEKAAGKQRKR
jgi:PRC-barrel domain protein